MDPATILLGGLASVGVHAGKKWVDSWFSGNEDHGGDHPRGIRVEQRGRAPQLVSRAAAQRRRPICVTGGFILDPWSRAYLTYHDIVLLGVVDHQQVSGSPFHLLECGLDGFELVLPPGTYSFYVFVVDEEPDDLGQASIWAFGFPTSADGSMLNELRLHRDAHVAMGLFDTGRFVDEPVVFGDLLELDGEDEEDEEDEDDADEEDDVVDELEDEDGDVLDLQGEWKLVEVYQFGTTTGRMFLDQEGSNLSGYALITDRTAEGERIVLRETFEGEINEADEIEMEGTSVRVLKGRDQGYNLDSWSGEVETPDLIVGESEDAEGVSGRFEMRRVPT